MTDELHQDQPDQETAPTNEVVESPEKTKANANGESLGEATAKFAADAAYAVAGFAGLVGEKAKAFYDEQRAEYAKTHPDVDSPGAREFLAQLSAHLDRFVDDVSRGFRDLSERGRDVVGRKQEDKTDPAPAGDQPEE